MNIISILEKIAIIVGISGGIVGLVSGLYPLYKSRVNLKLVLPKKEAYIYYDEVHYTDVCFETMRPMEYIDFNCYFTVDLGILNLSINQQMVYSIELVFTSAKNEKYIFYLDTDEKNIHRFYSKEQPCVLPLKIDDSSAQLCSVSFFLGKLHDINELDVTDGTFKIYAYCLDKKFSKQIENIKISLELL